MNYLIPASAERLIKIFNTCFLPVFGTTEFNFTPSYDPCSYRIFCQKWGEIGKVIFLEASPGKTELQFEIPQSVYSGELPQYEQLLREESIGPRGRLAEILGQKDIVDKTLSQALYERRLQRQQEFKAWLFNRLQIFGYREYYLDPVVSDPTKTDENFNFRIKGTPAQFAVMLQQFTQTLCVQVEYHQLLSQIIVSGSRRKIKNIPTDANPVEVKLTFGKNQCSLNAHTLPLEGTLLRIQLKGEKCTWELWDWVRDELERLGWFSLIEIPINTISVGIKAENINQQIESRSDSWMSIPDIGANREILRHWHNGLTCEQIAARVGLTEKTVLNRINRLRKEYGLQVVPYRKSSSIKKVKKLPS
jgi:hypothetical protein